MTRRGIRIGGAHGAAVIAAVLAAAGAAGLAAPPQAGEEGAVRSAGAAPLAMSVSRGAEGELAAVLADFDAAQIRTASMVAEFIEEKRIKLLTHALVSRGLFTFRRPNQVRWEYREPQRRLFVITEDQYLAYYPSEKKAEEVPISKFVGKRLFRFIGVGQSIGDLETYYAFRLEPQSGLAGTRLLVLTPRKKRVQDKIAEVRIWVDATSSLPRRFQYLEAGGDSTTITFQETRANAEVGAGSFEVRLPDDVAVSQTFGGFALSGQGF